MTSTSIYSVSQINHYVNNLFSQDYLLRQVSVRGEISELKDHPNGHLYFTLRDERSALPAAMFANNRARGLKTVPKVGMKVVVTGEIGFYEAGGRVQFYVKTMEADGEGERYREFLLLKQKLEEMGMFDASYKKPIPKYARTVGIVTSASGAALQDIIRVTKERNPYVQLYLAPATVQGEQAPASIVSAIRKMDAFRPDVMIVGRGGGSVEDLFCFNDESVARAIFDAETPVISAVGHEVDFTIADFVADYRAATPSQAAELAVFDYLTFRQTLVHAYNMQKRALEGMISDYRKAFQVREASLNAVHPRTVLREKTERLAALYEDTLTALTDRITKTRQVLSSAEPALTRLAERAVEEKKRRLTGMEPELKRLIDKAFSERKERTAVLAARLSALSPLEKLKHGYGFVERDGAPLRSVHETHPGESLTVYLSDGSVSANVTEVKGLES